jgi:hypothetical protein
MVIQPGDTATLNDPYMILSFFRWTNFSTDAFEMFFGHRDITFGCGSSFFEIASLDTAHSAATVTVSSEIHPEAIIFLRCGEGN